MLKFDIKAGKAFNIFYIRLLSWGSFLMFMLKIDIRAGKAFSILYTLCYAGEAY